MDRQIAHALFYSPKAHYSQVGARSQGLNPGLLCGLQELFPLSLRMNISKNLELGTEVRLNIQHGVQYLNHWAKKYLSHEAKYLPHLYLKC